MCFTPLASALTATAEFGISGYILKKDAKKELRPLAAFTTVLGFYQVAEFFLCTTAHPEIWARAGFIAYTFLPVILLHTMLRLSGVRFLKMTYAVPIAFSLLALRPGIVLLYSECNLVTASVHHVIFGNEWAGFIAYCLYYALFPLAGLGVYLTHLRKSEERHLPWKMRVALGSIPFAVLLSELSFLLSIDFPVDQNRLWDIQALTAFASLCVAIILAGIPLMRSSKAFTAMLVTTLTSSALTALILFSVFPQFNENFPSVYCHFALLYGVAAVLITRQRTSQA